MRKSTLLCFNKIGIFQKLIGHKRSLLMIFFLISGIALGVLFFVKSNTLETHSEKLFLSLIESKSDNGFLKIFLNSCSSFLLFLLLLFVLGSSLMGILFIPLSVFISGLYYGIISSYVCAEYALKGIAFNSVILVPISVLFFGITVFTSVNAFDFSTQFAKLTLYKNSSINLYFPFKSYCIKFSVSCILYILAALIDAIFSSCFLSFFTFK